MSRENFEFIIRIIHPQFTAYDLRVTLDGALHSVMIGANEPRDHSYRYQILHKEDVKSWPILTSTDGVPGHKVEKVLDVLVEQVYGTSPPDPVLDIMMWRARKLGADAVVGMKFIQESHELATLYGAAVKLQKLDEAVKTSAGADDHFLNVLITHMSRQLSSMRLGDQPNKQQ